MLIAYSPVPLHVPSQEFFFSNSEIPDFAALGAYVMDYIRVLVPGVTYLRYNNYGIFFTYINLADKTALRL